MYEEIDLLKARLDTLQKLLEWTETNVVNHGEEAYRATYEAAGYRIEP